MNVEIGIKSVQYDALFIAVDTIESLLVIWRMEQETNALSEVMWIIPTERFTDNS